MVASSMPSCRTSSSNFMIGTGLKKCIPITLPTLSVTLAISEILMLEVLLARMACGGANRSKSLKICCFKASTSGTASITSSTPSNALANSSLPNVVIFFIHVAFCSGVVLPLAIPFSQNASMLDRPAASPSGKAS